MKIIKSIYRLFSYSFIAIVVGGCMDINQQPMSDLPEDMYFETEAQLEYYVNDLYNVLPKNDQWNYGAFQYDNNTDNMSSKGYDNKFVPGQWRVPQSDTDNWKFEFIYQCNYMLERVFPKLENGQIQGNDSKIKQYIGETLVFRAYEYFQKLQKFGDFPILDKTLPNDMEKLVAESKRAPRTEVVHFILDDLDKAINEYLLDEPDGKRVRISKNAALLLKSRVALYEATWLKYFNNTAFVPGGPGWPGALKADGQNYSYPKGSIEAEINFLLDETMSSAKLVADNIPLVVNNGVLPQSVTDPENLYLKMYGDEDLSKYSEVLLWREYSRSLSVTHNVPNEAQIGNSNVGLTRGYVESFLMEDGLPIYAANSNYQGDNYISDVRKNRDGRLWLFLKEPDQINVLINKEIAIRGNLIEGYPNIIVDAQGYATGYSLRKGGSFDGKQLEVNGGCYTGQIIFRAAEAYLNYIEASYEKNNKLDATALNYWKAIRDRAKVDNDVNKTIAATDMAKEALNDWGAYSGGQLIDATLYNIRRERRSELLAEGFRMMDLKRWRALDQLITNPYHIEGFKLWGPMQEWYKDEKGKSQLKYGTGDANVSGPEQGVYLRPQEINPNSLVLKNGGCKWAKAHYLDPVAIQNFLITGGVESSHLYQNPYWPTRANEGAIE